MTGDPGGPLTFVAGAAEAGVRADRAVVRHAPGVGRRGAAELFERGAVRVEGRRVRKGRTESFSRD